MKADFLAFFLLFTASVRSQKPVPTLVPSPYFFGNLVVYYCLSTYINISDLVVYNSLSYLIVPLARCDAWPACVLSH